MSSLEVEMSEIVHAGERERHCDLLVSTARGKCDEFRPEEEPSNEVTVETSLKKALWTAPVDSCIYLTLSRHPQEPTSTCFFHLSTFHFLALSTLHCFLAHLPFVHL